MDKRDPRKSERDFAIFRSICGHGFQWRPSHCQCTAHSTLRGPPLGAVVFLKGMQILFFRTHQLKNMKKRTRMKLGHLDNTVE